MGHLELTRAWSRRAHRSIKLRTGRLTGGLDQDHQGHGPRASQLWIDDNPALTVTEIRSKARRLQDRLDQPLGLIVIDYLQLMSGRGSAESRQVRSPDQSGLRSGP
jgi:replicative DNA helicase